MTTTCNLETLPGDEELALCNGFFDGGPRVVTILDLDEDGVIAVGTLTLYGCDGVPGEVWRRRLLRWHFPHPPSRDALAEALCEGGDLRSLLERIHAGHSVEWDGHNMAGIFTADASEASDAVHEILASLEPQPLEACEAVDWIGDQSSQSLLDDCGLTVASSTEDISEACDRLVRVARRKGHVIIGGSAALREPIEAAIAAVRAETAKA